MAHIKAKGELSPTDAALHEKVAKAAYAAAAVDGLTAQVQPLLTADCCAVLMLVPVHIALHWAEGAICDALLREMPRKNWLGM